MTQKQQWICRQYADAASYAPCPGNEGERYGEKRKHDPVSLRHLDAGLDCVNRSLAAFNNHRGRQKGQSANNQPGNQTEDMLPMIGSYPNQDRRPYHSREIPSA